MRGRGRVVGLATATVLVSACAAGSGASAPTPAPVVVQESAAASVAAEPTATAPATPDPAPSTTMVSTDAPANTDALRFTAPALGGGTIDGTDYAGGDVVLWMWAHWCPQCNREAPDVAAAAERFGDRVTFIGIPEHADDASLQEFVDRHDLHDVVQAVDDEQGSIWTQYGINYQPAWVFIDEDGTVQVHAGPLYDDLDERVQALVDQ